MNWCPPASCCFALWDTAHFVAKSKHLWIFRGWLLGSGAPLLLRESPRCSIIHLPPPPGYPWPDDFWCLSSTAQLQGLQREREREPLICKLALQSSQQDQAEATLLADITPFWAASASLSPLSLPCWFSWEHFLNRSLDSWAQVLLLEELVLPKIPLQLKMGSQGFFSYNNKQHGL